MADQVCLRSVSKYLSNISGGRLPGVTNIHTRRECRRELDDICDQAMHTVYTCTLACGTENLSSSIMMILPVGSGNCNGKSLNIVILSLDNGTREKYVGISSPITSKIRHWN